MQYIGGVFILTFPVWLIVMVGLVVTAVNYKRQVDRLMDRISDDTLRKLYRYYWDEFKNYLIWGCVLFVVHFGAIIILLWNGNMTIK